MHDFWTLLLPTSVLLLLLLRCHEAAALSAAPGGSARIVGGAVTSIEAVPYLMQLRKSGQFFCGGSLIAPNHVLTAAHCVKGVSASILSVVGGASALAEAGQRRGVAKVFIPKAYSASNLHMDVALLKLSAPMAGRHIATIALCDTGGGGNWSVGETVQVSGWGQTSEQSAAVAQRVRTAHVPLIAKAKCRQQYKQQATLTSSMFCAAVAGARDACAGDSGGPAVYKGELCGIVSWGVGCARANYPGVYTSIKSARPFIESAMKK